MTKKTSIEAQTLKIPKVILLTAKLLEVISPKLVTLFASKLFTTPIKHKIPKREHHMDSESKQHILHVPSIKKDIHIYHYGSEAKKVLLVHGWSGRGTQLVKIADELLKLGYSTVSFDAPAHGKSKGNSTIMIEFIESILEIDKQFGPFKYAIGHSLGGMSTLNAINQNLNIKKAVIIGSGDIIQDIINDFIAKLELKNNIAFKLRDHFEKKFHLKMDDFSASKVGKNIKIPILIIHDKNDVDVEIKAAYNIQKNISNSELFITEKLGHRKILGNSEVIKKIIEFIN
jgi:pimeloyl-ACP methyl ester carboxylesterase